MESSSTMSNYKDPREVQKPTFFLSYIILISLHYSLPYSFTYVKQLLSTAYIEDSIYLYISEEETKSELWTPNTYPNKCYWNEN